MADKPNSHVDTFYLEWCYRLPKDEAYSCANDIAMLHFIELDAIALMQKCIYQLLDNGECYLR